MNANADRREIIRVIRVYSRFRTAAACDAMRPPSTQSRPIPFDKILSPKG